VTLEIGAGEVLALVGENGAGKSTLMKILGGVYQPDDGEIRIDGKPVSIHNVTEAMKLGIAFIHQELNVLTNLDVAANVFLGREPRGALGLIDRKKIHAEAAPFLKRLGLDVATNTRLDRLSIAQQQLVEIAKALSLKARLIIMDEPTSSLTLSETNRLLDLVCELRDQGVSIIYISHRLGELDRCANRVLVLRDGRAQISRSYRRYRVTIIATALGIALVIVLARQPLLSLFAGNAFAREQDILMGLLVASFFLLACNVASYYLLLALGASKPVSLISTGSMLLALALTVILVPAYGLNGAAVGRLAYGLGTLALLERAQRVLR